MYVYLYDLLIFEYPGGRNLALTNIEFIVALLLLDVDEQVTQGQNTSSQGIDHASTEYYPYNTGGDRTHVE